MAEELHIQTSYAQYAGAHLQRFKKVNTYLWNFRCPVCGDSQKNKSKARAYFYKKPNGLLGFVCHNCNEPLSFGGLLKYISDQLYREYRLETYKGSSAYDVPEREEVPVVKEWRMYVTPIGELSKMHPAVRYVKGRLIPKTAYDCIFYAPNFKDFVESLGLEQTVYDEPRIVFVETDRFDNLKIIIARAINDDSMRYITLTVDPEYPKLFGLGRIDHTKRVHVVEGAIDSLFVDNCIATLDSSLTAYRHSELIKNPVLIWDNEPRSPIIVAKLKRAVLAGEKVVIFPNQTPGKDINQMVEAGLDVQQIINNNICQGPIALLRLAKWKRCVNATRKTVGKN